MEMKDKVWQGELLGHKNIGCKRLFECSHIEGTRGDSAQKIRSKWPFYLIKFQILAQKPLGKFSKSSMKSKLLIQKLFY